LLAYLDGNTKGTLSEMTDTTNKMNQQVSEHALMPVLYLPHGGGPMPLLGEEGHQELIHFLKNIPKALPTPKAVLMVSAHWESVTASVSSSPNPQMIYDYSGFPPESYTYQYPAAGDPALAQTIIDYLQSHDIECSLDARRGYDHGTFVPLMLMYPDADIPVVQLSLLRSLDPAKHIALGEAVASLREQGVLIIGSGMSFHERNGSYAHSAAFDGWLTNTLVSQTAEEAKDRLVDWASAPSARESHQREEHLLPLHVCFGAATGHVGQTDAPQKVYSGLLFGKRIAAFLWR
jgi:aromatic ring-opening dioxygenase catalytic subunit (LigB family)